MKREAAIPANKSDASRVNGSRAADMTHIPARDSSRTPSDCALHASTASDQASYVRRIQNTPASMNARLFLNLQRTCGNRFVQRLVNESQQSEFPSHGTAHRPAVSVAPAVQRQTDPVPSTNCDKDHADVITKAEGEAAGWVGSAIRWVEAHREHIKRAAPSGGDYHAVGALVLGELQLLDRHFRISDVIRGEMHTLFPSSPNSTGSFTDFNNWGRANYVVLRRLSDVRVRGVAFNCEQACPKAANGADIAGSAVPGSGSFQIYANCFDAQAPVGKTGVVLHEAFHASFSEFNHDTYSTDSNYPGPQPLTNAESFATFASIAATGSDFRIITLPEITITANPRPPP